MPPIQKPAKRPKKARKQIQRRPILRAEDIRDVVLRTVKFKATLVPSYLKEFKNITPDFGQRKPLKRKSRPAKVRQTPGAKARLAADRIWSEKVRAKGPCVALGHRTKFMEISGSGEVWVLEWDHRICYGPMDPAHVFSRRYKATRHDEDNGVPLCRWAHEWFTAHQLEWLNFASKLLGPVKYEALRLKAQGRSE